jgi:hypothetical protein
MRANSLSVAGGAARQEGMRAVQDSAECGAWPEVMSQTARHAGSIHAAPRVGQAQSTRRARSEIRTLPGLHSVCRRLVPASDSGALV